VLLDWEEVLFRLSVARKLTPLSNPGQLALKADQLGATPSISGSFAADLQFLSADRQLQIPTLASEVHHPVTPRLKSELLPMPDVSLLLPNMVAPINVGLGTVHLLSRLAVFQPYFRVEGKHYGESESAGHVSRDASNVGRRAGERAGRAGGIFISRWDALWPLLQPPLNFAFPESLDLPSDLRPYQIDGIRFLADGESVLLGDDMGTGKTVQAVVALRILFQKGKVSKALVVCPLAVLSTWESHLLNWGRVLKCVMVRGNRNERKMQWQTAAHVYIATYDTVREDVSSLMADEEPPEFDLVIADEVQKIKNSGTATAKAMRSIVASRRWGLSATPFENRPEELVSVFGFIKPGLLVRDREDARSIRNKIAPFFLRRTKDLLKDELPEKVHDVLWLELGPVQRSAYDLAEKQGVIELEKQGEKITVSHVLALLGKLKQLCNFEPKTGESVKLETLRDELEEVTEQGSKALVFTQFKDFGVTRIKSGLGLEGLLDYTGDLGYSEREKVLKKFENDPSCRLLLCTQAAAGLGLNLTAANYVFHFDHWWNPARTAQAEDRVHRIGQKKTVFVYHFWVKKTVEERIYNILQRKRAQFEEIIGPMSNAEGTGLSEEELFEVFGLKRATRTAPRPRAVEAPKDEAPLEVTAPTAIPDVDVWPLIRKTELALRKCVREILVQCYGLRAQERVLAHLGSEEAARITDTIAQYRRRYATTLDEFSPSEDPLDYTYLKQMMQVISREWQLFKPIFGDRGYVDSKVSEIAAVRNDEAHFRGIPPVEKMRAYVACSDLLVRLQQRAGAPAGR
jgi:superfamily II DNA or RNA helicase